MPLFFLFSFLIYGIKAILSIEFEIPSFQIALPKRLSHKQSLVDCLECLEVLNEAKRKNAQHKEAI